MMQAATGLYPDLGNELSILILGTSNAVMKGGWTYGLRAALPAARIDTFAVGGSICAQFSAHMSRDFSEYDFVFFDSVPNDEQYVGEGGNHPYIDRIFFEMASTIQAQSNLIVLGLPREENLLSSSNLYRGRQRAAAACGAQFLDMRHFIKEFGPKVLENDERLYEDAPHPNRKLSALFGFLIGQALPVYERDSSPNVKAESFAARFKNIHAADLLRSSTLVLKSNSLLNIAFAELLPGDQLNLKELGKCTGFFLDKSDTKCRASVVSDDDTISWRLLFKDKPGSFAYYFQPLKINQVVDHLSILSREKAESGFPTEFSSLPSRALISDIGFWDGDANQPVPVPEDLVPSTVLYQAMMTELEKQLPEWHNALKSFRRGIDRRNAGNAAEARKLFDAADELLPASGSFGVELSKLFRNLSHMPALAVDVAAMPLRRTNFRFGVQMASSCGLTPGNTRTGDATSFNQRISMTASRVADWSNIVACLANFDSSTIGPGPNSLKWRCSLEYPKGVITPFVWEHNKDEITCEPGGIHRSRPAGTVIPAGARFWFRSHVEVPAGGQWVTSKAILQPGVGSGLEQPAIGDKSMSGDIPASYGFAAPVPAALTGLATGSKKVSTLNSLAIWGDSILEGRNDTARRGENSDLGWAARAAARLQIGYVQVSKAGTAAYQQRSLAYFNHKAQLIEGCSHVVTNFGTNDIGHRRRSSQLLINDVSVLAERLHDCGHIVILCTLLPRGMPDTGQLLKGDSPQTIEELMKYNAWVRTDPFAAGIFDAAGEVCDASDPSIWRLDLGTPTQDGLHPNPCIHEHLAEAFSAQFSTIQATGNPSDSFAAPLGDCLINL